MSKYSAEPILIGVDEAGRGPIAGPVTVAAVAFITPFDLSCFEGVKDSKKLSPKKRDFFRSVLNERQAEGVLRYAVHSTGASVIDEQGIVYALKSSLRIVLNELAFDPTHTMVKLDGALKAPEEYLNQQTIIKGDETELPISLASIIAKTTRDKEMEGEAKRYPVYGFDKHKGYGTKMHYQAIETHGPCRIHRMSFLGT